MARTKSKAPKAPIKSRGVLAPIPMSSPSREVHRQGGGGIRNVWFVGAGLLILIAGIVLAVLFATGVIGRNNSSGAGASPPPSAPVDTLPPSGTPPSGTLPPVPPGGTPPSGTTPPSGPVDTLPPSGPPPQQPSPSSGTAIDFSKQARNITIAAFALGFLGLAGYFLLGVKVEKREAKEELKKQGFIGEDGKLLRDVSKLQEMRQYLANTNDEIARIYDDIYEWGRPAHQGDAEAFSRLTRIRQMLRKHLNGDAFNVEGEVLRVLPSRGKQAFKLRKTGEPFTKESVGEGLM